MAEATRRWPGGHFTFVPPPGFPRVVATEPRGFALSAYPVTREGLWVRSSEHGAMVRRLGDDALPEAMRRAAEPLRLAAGLLREAAVPAAVLGRPALRADVLVPDGPDSSGMACGVLVARGPDDWIWTFAYRGSVPAAPRLRSALGALLTSLVLTEPPTRDEALRAQWEGQAERQAALARELGEPEGDADYTSLSLKAARTEFLRRYGFAAGGAVDPALLSEAIGLAEEAGACCPPGASRVGGAPDLPQGA